MIIDNKLNTDTITQDLIEHIVNKIVTLIQPEKIIIFGSYSRGNYNDSSDLDLLVIKKTNQSIMQIRRSIDSLLRGRKFALDILIRTPEQIEWNIKADNPFYTNDILKEGKILYEKS